MASSTVISLSRLIISWISDATIHFVGFAYGFVLFGWLCPSGGHVPWPSSTAVYFRFLFDVFCITAFYEAGSSLMPSVWLSAGVVAFAVG